MRKLWSELPHARARELAADVATVFWIGCWIVLSRRLYAGLAAHAGVGRAIQDGGDHLESAGRDIGAALGNIPVIGQGIGDLIRGTIAAAAVPFQAFGSGLERSLLAIAALFGLIVLVLALAPWLARYVPWRWKRLRTLHAAHRAIRMTPRVPVAELERVLASRAIHRLPYEELLEYSTDPLGDWVSGRYARLAEAELASVGLQPVAAWPQPDRWGE